VILLLGCIIASVQPLESCAFAQGQVNEETEVDQQKRIAACEVPEREKPNGEIKRVSQLCGHALSLPKPAYPEEAKASGVPGTVVVEIVTNEEGRVVWANAISGPESLRGVSVKAACRPVLSYADFRSRDSNRKQHSVSFQGSVGPQNS